MLRTELDTAKRSVNTDTVQISIGEIASMYANQELDIVPEFQRLFRWSIEKKTAFIESILIGIPVPPAFAYEQEDGTWELIDGLQRISTVLEFMGLLRNADDPSKTLPPSTLAPAKYLPSLDGVQWNSCTEAPSTVTLEKSLQLFFRRARIDFQVLKYPSDPTTKFDLFQRLNRGGSYANEQEVRSCAMVLANSEATAHIRSLGQNEQFHRIFRITPDQRVNQKDIEYAVRCMVHTYRDFRTGTDVQDFLDRGIVEILTGPYTDRVIEQVRWAVATLDRLYGRNALIPHEDARPGIKKQFSLRALEGIVVGLSRNSTAISELPNPDDFVSERVHEFWRQDEVAQLSSSGLRGTTRIQRSVPFGATWFAPNG